MNERKMMIVILAILVLLNIGLFGYGLYQRSVRDWIPEERVDQIRQIYAQAGIPLEAVFRACGGRPGQHGGRIFRGFV